MGRGAAAWVAQVFLQFSVFGESVDPGGGAGALAKCRRCNNVYMSAASRIDSLGRSVHERSRVVTAAAARRAKGSATAKLAAGATLGAVAGVVATLRSSSVEGRKQRLQAESLDELKAVCINLRLKHTGSKAVLEKRIAEALAADDAACAPDQPLGKLVRRLKVITSPAHVQLVTGHLQNKYKADMLKDICKQLRLPSSGKKAELASRIVDGISVLSASLPAFDDDSSAFASSPETAAADGLAQHAGQATAADEEEEPQKQTQKKKAPKHDRVVEQEQPALAAEPVTEAAALHTTTPAGAAEFAGYSSATAADMAQPAAPPAAEPPRVELPAGPHAANPTRVAAPAGDQSAMPSNVAEPAVNPAVVPTSVAEPANHVEVVPTAAIPTSMAEVAGHPAAEAMTAAEVAGNPAAWPATEAGPARQPATAEAAGYPAAVPTDVSEAAGHTAAVMTEPAVLPSEVPVAMEESEDGPLAISSMAAESAGSNEATAVISTKVRESAEDKAEARRLRSSLRRQRLATYMAEELANVFGKDKPRYIEDMNKLLHKAPDTAREAYLADKIESANSSAMAARAPALFGPSHEVPEYGGWHSETPSTKMVMVGEVGPSRQAWCRWWDNETGCGELVDLDDMNPVAVVSSALQTGANVSPRLKYLRVGEFVEYRRVWRGGPNCTRALLVRGIKGWPLMCEVDPSA